MATTHLADLVVTVSASVVQGSATNVVDLVDVTLVSEGILHRSDSLLEELLALLDVSSFGGKMKLSHAELKGQKAAVRRPRREIAQPDTERTRRDKAKGERRACQWSIPGNTKKGSFETRSTFLALGRLGGPPSEVFAKLRKPRGATECFPKNILSESHHGKRKKREREKGCDGVCGSRPPAGAREAASPRTYV